MNGEGVLDEIERIYHSDVSSVTRVLDTHEWLPPGRCACGFPTMDWWTWRSHAAPFIALRD